MIVSRDTLTVIDYDTHEAMTSRSSRLLVINTNNTAVQLLLCCITIIFYFNYNIT